MRKIGIVSGVALLFISSPAAADVKITPFSKSLFDGCVQGYDIGAMTKVSNPLLLLGSIIYTGDVLKEDGTIGKGLVRQPLSLPLITSDAASPDVSTCSHNFSTSADGNISFLGFGLNASKSDIYKVTVHLVARQKLAPVAQGGANVQPWFSDLYKPQFTAALAAADASVTSFFLFDNISIYLLEVEKYRKVSGGLSGVFGVVTGGANYARDETFKGTKIIVTGDPVPIARAMFAGTTVTSSRPTLPNEREAVRTLTESDRSALQARLVEAATRD